MEASAITTTPTTVTSLDDTTQEYVHEEPLDSETPFADEEASAAATPTAVTSLNDDDTSQEYEKEEPLESRTSIVDGGDVGVVIKLKEGDVDVHATMTRTLPKYVIIQSNHNHTYLRYNGENPILPNALHFDGDYSFSLDTRFEVVPATTGAGLVHIRCLYNNKYLAHFGGSIQWVTAMAVKPEEDQSNRHCTLFRPYFENSSNNRVCRLRHVNTGQFVRRFNGGSNHQQGLLTLRPKVRPNDKTDEYTIIDWESVVVFPDLIRIKNEQNGNHLLARSGDTYLDFRNRANNSSAYDYEVIPSRNGGIRLKSVARGTFFLEESNTYIQLRQVSATVHNTNTVFVPTVLPGNRILFRCLRSNRFCRNLSIPARPAWRNLLAARATYPDPESYMELEEPVLSRTITNVRYRLDDAVIHDQNISAIITDATNNRTSQTITGELDLRTTVTNATNWSNSLTWTLGVEMSLSAGIPKIGSAGFSISTEFSEQTTWGKTWEESQEVGSLRSVPVPPMTRVEGFLMATRASYDIPFSYTQTDILANGNRKTYQKQDGVFTGRDGYGYEFDFVELPLPS